MKKNIYLIILLFLISSCNRPLKLFEKGKDKKALQASLHRLKKGKINIEHIYVLEKSFQNITMRDAEIILKMKKLDNPDLWLKIRTKAYSIDLRQKKVEKVVERLERKGYYPKLEFYPAKEVIEEATDRLALFYYKKAIEYISLARKGKKEAARKAYTQLLNCKKYRPSFKDVVDLEKEMFRLGTTYILMETTYSNLNSSFHNDLLDRFFWKSKFPLEFKWLTFFYCDTMSTSIDFKAIIHFDELTESGYYTGSSFCSNTESVQVGCEIQQAYNEKDSTYYNIEVPIYEDVSVTITTYSQHRDATLRLNCKLLEAKSNSIVEEFFIKSSGNWNNRYSEVSGDVDACDSYCSDEGGTEDYYPPEAKELWLEAAYSSKYTFYKFLKKKVD